MGYDKVEFVSFKEGDLHTFYDYNDSEINAELQYEGELIKLTINTYGKIPEDGKIKFIDENSKPVKISLHVGSEYVDEEP